jgi:hypothetical protein
MLIAVIQKADKWRFLNCFKLFSKSEDFYQSLNNPFTSRFEDCF